MSVQASINRQWEACDNFRMPIIIKKIEAMQPTSPCESYQQLNSKMKRTVISNVDKVKYLHNTFLSKKTILKKFVVGSLKPAKLLDSSYGKERISVI